MKRKLKPLTPDQEAFYAGFKPVSTKPVYSGPPREGDVIRIVGKHPYTGKRGTVKGYRLCAGAGVGMLIEIPDTEGTFVFKRENFEIIERKSTNGRELIEALLPPEPARV